MNESIPNLTPSVDIPIGQRRHREQSVNRKSTGYRTGRTEVAPDGTLLGIAKSNQPAPAEAPALEEVETKVIAAPKPKAKKPPTTAQTK